MSQNNSISSRFWCIFLKGVTDDVTYLHICEVVSIETKKQERRLLTALFDTLETFRYNGNSCRYWCNSCSC